jgi:hypothetical protein
MTAGFLADPVGQAAGCTCFVTDAKYWTVHYGAVEPGSMWEPNPDCPEHFPGGLRKRLTEELKAADDEHTAALVEAVGGRGDWFAVRQAAEVVRQCRAALKAVGEEQ